MNSAAAGSDFVMMDTASGATGGDGIAVDVLLMVANVVMIDLHVRSFSGEPHTNVAALCKKIVMDVYISTFYVQPQNIIAWIVSAFDLRDPAVEAIVMNMNIRRRAQKLDGIGASQVNVSADAKYLSRLCAPAALNGGAIFLRSCSLYDMTIADSGFPLIFHPDAANLIIGVVAEYDGMSIHIQNHIIAGYYKCRAVSSYVLGEYIYRIRFIKNKRNALSLFRNVYCILSILRGKAEDFAFSFLMSFRINDDHAEITGGISFERLQPVELRPSRLFCQRCSFPHTYCFAIFHVAQGLLTDVAQLPVNNRRCLRGIYTWSLKGVPDSCYGSSVIPGSFNSGERHYLLPLRGDCCREIPFQHATLQTSDACISSLNEFLGGFFTL